jgi:hypothetical protein
MPCPYVEIRWSIFGVLRFAVRTGVWPRSHDKPQNIEAYSAVAAATAAKAGSRSANHEGRGNTAN